MLAFAMATAITLPLIVISWLGCKPSPCFAIRSSRSRITSSFINATMDEFAMIAVVYSAGLPCIPARFSVWCSDVRLLLPQPTLTHEPQRPAPTVWIAGNSLP